jgi:hypothetical protein
MRWALSLVWVASLWGCDSQKAPPSTKPSTAKPIGTAAIRYRSRDYGLFLGQSLDSVRKVTDCKRDHMNDNAKDGLDHYFSISEPLGNCGNGEFLPALYFTFRRDTLVRFTLSVSDFHMDFPTPDQVRNIHQCLDSLYGIGSPTGLWMEDEETWEVEFPAKDHQPSYRETWQYSAADEEHPLDQFKYIMEWVKTIP